MPLYDYKCKDCGDAFTTRHGFDGPKAAVSCPGCESTETFKTISGAPSIVFNWWNAAASDSAGLTYRRHHPAIPRAGG